MTHPDWLHHHAATSPDRPAVLAGGAAWTWAELARRTRGLAAGLAAEGVRDGDRVAALLPNGPEYVALVHALRWVGAALVPLNARLAVPELAWQLGDADPMMLLRDDANAGLASAAVSARAGGGRAVVVRELAALAMTRRGDLAHVEAVEGAERVGGHGANTRSGANASFAPTGAPGGGTGDTGPARTPAPPRAVDLGALQGIVYTSGTTGTPKGALLTWSNHFHSAVASAANLGHRADDRWLALLPLYHVGGLAMLMRSAVFGVPVELHPRFDPAVANAAIDRGATLVSLVVAMLVRMLDARGDRSYPPTLRAVLLGGGPAPPALVERALRVGMPVFPTYGMTETASQAVTLPPEDAGRKPGAAGKPLLFTELRIADDAGGTSPPGEPGEIVLRGPIVSPGYWRRAPGEGRTPDGWLLTGDLGALDAEGYLTVLDRRDDLLISGGENVYPAEVEAALLEHPEVRDAGVVGVPDSAWGAVPVASVVLSPGAMVDPEALRAHCRTRLAGYKVPARVRIVPELPRTGSGKLLRRALRERSNAAMGDEQ